MKFSTSAKWSHQENTVFDEALIPVGVLQDPRHVDLMEKAHVHLKRHKDETYGEAYRRTLRGIINRDWITVDKAEKGLVFMELLRDALLRDTKIYPDPEWLKDASITAALDIAPLVINPTEACRVLREARARQVERCNEAIFILQNAIQRLTVSNAATLGFSDQDEDDDD